MNCLHPDTVPVYAYLHHVPIEVGQEAWAANDGNPVAHLCARCLTQLPANWGCTDCEWEHIESRRLCDPAPEIHTVCTRLCPAHQEDHP